MRKLGIGVALAVLLAGAAAAQTPGHGHAAISTYESDGAVLNLRAHSIIVKPASGSPAPTMGSSLSAPANCSQGRVLCADIGFPLALDRAAVDAGATYRAAGYRYSPQCLHTGRQGRCRVAMIRFGVDSAAAAGRDEGYFVYDTTRGVIALSDAAHDPLGHGGVWTHRSGAEILSPAWMAWARSLKPGR